MTEQVALVLRDRKRTMAVLIKLALIIEALKPMAQAKNISHEQLTTLALKSMLDSPKGGN